MFYALRAKRFHPLSRSGNSTRRSGMVISQTALHNCNPDGGLSQSGHLGAGDSK